MVRRFRGPDQTLVHVGLHPRYFSAHEEVPEEILPLLGDEENVDRLTYDDDAPAPAEDGGGGEGPEGGAGGGAGSPDGWAELDGKVSSISAWVGEDDDLRTQRAQYALDQELARGEGNTRPTLIAELQAILGIS